jgi:histidine triad (HIT) family protein
LATVEDCVFCRIVRGDIDARVAHRADGMMAFHDVAPKAPVHILVIPENHVSSIAASDGLSEEERARMLTFIAETATRAGLDESGYRVTTNHGPDGRQSVHHLHWHVMGGTRLSDTM